MKIPEDAQNRKDEILKAFGCRAFSSKCVARINTRADYYDTAYFYNDEESNTMFVWCCSEEVLQDMRQGRDNIIELFINYKLKYLNKEPKDV